MDYTLDTLGPRDFEHVVQALAMQKIGPNMSSFGDGPDGGREARWDGPCPSLNIAETWNGYGVVQAKFRLHPADPENNYHWIKNEVSKELKEWSNVDSKRKIKPNFILFATNVRLSAASNGGKDKIRDFIINESNRLELKLTDTRIWDYDDIRSLIDGSSDVRVRYAAFLTPGDVISKLMSDLKWDDEQFKRTILSHAAKTFTDDNSLNLTQAGAVSDSVPTVSDVVIDLPAHLSARSTTFENNLLNTEESGIVAQLINLFNQSFSEIDKYGTRRAVVIGGPGQGKSTVTQWLAQIYRANFMRYTTIASSQDMREPLKRLTARCIELELPSIGPRRWPFRIILTEFADYLSENNDRSLLSFIVDSVSRGAAEKIDSKGIMRWLESYPWILLIDGLDEIPATSNRVEVMTSIRNFFFDVTTVNGDVAVIATTRPQGYSDEFPPDKYMEFILSPLDSTKALEYADGLIAIRHGFGTQIADKVSQRMQKAVEEPTTARLLETPLQVTILTVLLEKLGHAPRQRWRLFSQYYKVITQREQEKGGELSELLQEYESDVDYLHRHIGELLQHRGSMAGDTSSTITKEEFDRIIAARLADQGHNADAVERLRHNFSRLVTDRLVFLALVTSEKIGFELRSLQEFMAAERVLALPERDIIDRLRIISTSSYWRNVALFVAGGIFSARESLKADIILLCKDMNRNNIEEHHFSSIKPGSSLAIDILIDGSCNSQPIYIRGLADAALDAIRGPRNNRLSELASVTDKSTRQLIREAATDSGARASEIDNRMILTVGLGTLEPEPDDTENLEYLINHAGPDDLNILAVRAISSGDNTLAQLLESRIQDVDPIFLLNETHRTARFFREFTEDGDSIHESASWRSNWVNLLSDEDRRRGSFYLSNAEHSVSKSPRILGFAFTSTHGNGEPWRWILEIPSGNENWNLFRSIARFCLDPIIDNMVLALTAMATCSSADYVAFPGIPWVLSACIESAREYTAAQKSDDPNRDYVKCIESFITLAEAGKMGGPDDWISAEDRWTENPIDLHLAMTDFEPIEVDGRIWGNPAGLLTLRNGLVFTGMEFQVSHARHDEMKFNVDLIRSLVNQIQYSGGASKSSIVHIAFFCSSILFDSLDGFDDPDPEVRTSVYESAKELRDSISEIDFDFRKSIRPTWPVFFPGLDRSSLCSADLKLMKSFGCCNSLISPVRFSTHSNIIREAIELTEPKEHWMLARLGIILNPQSAESIPEDYLKSPINDPLLDETLCAWRIARANSTQIDTGSHDSDILTLLKNKKSAMNADWFISLMQGRPDQRGISLAVRISEIFIDVDPELAGEFLEIANQLLASMPVEITVSSS